MIRKLMIAAAAAGLFAAQPGMAQTAPSMAMGSGMAAMHGMHGGGAGLMMLLRSANLTPAQQSQVRQIIASARPQMEALHAQMEALHQQIADRLLTPGQVSAADVRPLVQKMSAVESELTENMTATAIAIRNVLTPEQLAQLTKVHKKLQSLHSQIRGLVGGALDTEGSGD
ncbi:MAG TPA: Spy/CpxP family protein refolding chaperone [Rhizomicrobium sp.]